VKFLHYHKGRAPIINNPISLCKQEIEQEKPIQIEVVDDNIIIVGWFGPMVGPNQEALYFSTCIMGGETICVQDIAFSNIRFHMCHCILLVFRYCWVFI